MIWPSNFIPRSLPKRNESLRGPRDGNAHNYRSMLYNSQEMKQPKCHPTWMDEQDTVYPETRITQPCKGMKRWHILQWGWTLKTWCKVKEARHRRPHKYSSICMKCSESRKLQQQKANLWLHGAPVVKVTQRGHDLSSCHDGKFP